MYIPIIFEDDNLVVIDKQAGVVVNRAENVREETIQDWAEDKLKIKSQKSKVKTGVTYCHPEAPVGAEGSHRDSSPGFAGLRMTSDNVDFYNRAGIVHRLDKETSGLLVIAKNPAVFYNLQSQFKQRLVTKKYLALVHGVVEPEEGEIKASVGRLPWNRRRFGILSFGKAAFTSYKVIARYKFENRDFTLLEVVPHTGRSHQIRIHLKYLGHSIVADYLYAGRKVVREDAKFCPRLFLHAAYLKFQHSTTLKWIEVKSSLPQDLQEVIGKLNLI